MLFLSEACETSSFLKVIYFIMELLKVVSIIIPIGLIAMLSFDFFKNVIAKEDEMSKNLKIAIKRVIYCLVIFLIPTIVNISVSLLNRAGIELDYNVCLSNANLNTIKYFEEEEAQIEEEEMYVPDTPIDRENNRTIVSKDSSGNNDSNDNDNASSSDDDYSDINSTGAQKILDIAEKKYKKIESDGNWYHSFRCSNNKCTTCCKFVSKVLIAAGYQKSGYICHMGYSSKPTGLDKLYKDKVSILYNQKISKLKPGDAVVYSNPNSTGGNVAIFAKKDNDKYYFYGASSTSEIKKKNHPSSHMSSYWKGKSGRLTVIRAKN